MIKEANRLNHIKEYYFSAKLQEIRGLISQERDIINLGIGNPDMAPSKKTIDSLTYSSQQQGNHGYQSYRGILELRESISKWQQKIFNIKLDPNTEILPLLGSKEGIMHITNAFVNPGDEVLVPNPGYPTYSSVTNLAGGKVVLYGLLENNDWQVDIAELEKQDLSKVKLMWINYPHMPTGAKCDTEAFESLIKLAKKHNFLLCNDNPYSLILNERPSSILEVDGAKEIALELNSLSKSHNMAGWRVGWISAAATYIDSILKVKSNIDSGMFLPVQHAAITALDNTATWHKEQNTEYKKRRELAWQIMDEIGAEYSTQSVGLFIWAKVNDATLDIEKFVDELIYEAGVFITPGKVFGSNGSRYLRISLCASEDLMRESLNRIKNYMNIRNQ